MGTKNSCKTAAVMGLIGRGPAAEAAPLEKGHATDLTRTPEIIYAEINFYSGTMLTSAIEIGRRMVELKEKLPHGSFIDEIKKNTPWSRSQINNFMRLFREYGNSNVQTFGHLSPSKALALLALPEAEREEFLGETHEVNGEEKAVIDMTSRELDRVIKERDEALRAAAQAQADQTAAEQARAKMVEDMALANERIAGLNAEVEAQSAKAKEAQDEVEAQSVRVKEAQDAAAQLEEELNELRSRPVEVAVEADPAAIEAARKEAEAAMQDKLNRAKKAKEKALSQAAEANEGVERARQELEQAQAELEALRVKAAQAEKKASLAANEDFVLFKTILERFREDGNRLCGLILKGRNKDQKMAEGFSKAFFASLDELGKEARG